MARKIVTSFLIGVFGAAVATGAFAQGATSKSPNEKPKPTVVPTDKPAQGAINRDDGKPTSPPTDPRNSPNRDGNPNSSN